MQHFSNLSYVHSYISVPQLSPRETQAFVLRLVSINNPKEQTANSKIQSVSNARSLCLSSSSGLHSRAKGRAPAPRESTACWHGALAFPRQHAQLSLNEFLLSSSPWADPTEQQLSNTCCSQIHHLSPQTTLANFLGNYRPSSPVGIPSQGLSRQRCLEGSSAGHLL